MAAPRALMAALWLWLAGSLAVGVVAAFVGGNTSLTGQVAVVAMAPAALSLLVLPRIDEAWTAFLLLASWLAAALVLVSMTGGAASPLIASLLIAPGLARLVAPAWVSRTAIAAMLCVPLAALLAPVLAMPGTGLVAECLTLLSIVFAGWLITVRTSGKSVREALLSQRIAEVSHELRTPLGHILGFAEILEREMFGPIGERNVEYAGLIRRSGAQLLELVNDLLDISKIEAGRYEIEREDFDARDILLEVVQLSRDAAEKKQIALQADAPLAPLKVHADPRALRRMLINTLGNALKFTPEGGRVTLAARAEGDKLVLDTIDTGPGISLEERERLGQAYERGASGANAEGTGLGLALVRALARLHGGTLSFHDAPGGGALVRIELPVLKP